MNTIPLHPSVVHIPIALAVLMPALAAGLLLCWWRGWLPKRVWLVAAALQVVLVGSALVAMRTGEGDEDRVEKVLASEAAIHEHEEAAEVFLWASAGVLVLFIAGAVIRQDKLARALASAAVAGSVVVLILGYRVGHAGGELVYQHGAARAFTGASPNVRAGDGHDDGPAGRKGDKHHDRDHDD